MVLVLKKETATKAFRDMVSSGHITLDNDSGNLCRNGAMKLCSRPIARKIVTATKVLRDMVNSGHVTLGNDSGNLCRNSTRKLQ